MRHHTYRVIPGLLIILVACLAMAPSLLYGVPPGHSYLYNLPWIEHFHQQFWSGDLYPKRLTGLWHGAGGLDFFFYGPLPFWISSITGGLLCPGCGHAAAFVSGATAMLAASGLAFYAFMRDYTARPAAALAAVVYMILPYHLLGEWYIRQSIGEFAAYIFLPLIARYLACVIGGRRGGAALALSVAGLILSHLPSALLGMSFFALCALMLCAARRLAWRDAAARLLRAGIWVLLGGALAAFYWYPAQALAGGIAAQTMFDAYADPLNWLLFDGKEAPSPVFLAHLIASFTAACLAALTGAVIPAILDRRPILWPVSALAFAWIVMTPLAAWLWRLPLFAKIQFPWRALVIADLGLAFAAGLACVFAVSTASRYLRLAALIVAAGFLAAAFYILAPSAYSNVQAAARGPAPYVNEGAVEYLPVSVAERGFARGGAAPRSYDNFRQQIAQGMSGLENVPDISGLAGPGRLAIVERESRRMVIDISQSKASTLHLKIFYWQFWRAYDRQSGRRLSIAPSEPYGLVALDVPAGQTQIVLTLPLLRSEKTGIAVSLLAVFALAGYRAFSYYGTHRRRSGRPGGYTA